MKGFLFFIAIGTFVLYILMRGSAFPAVNVSSIAKPAFIDVLDSSGIRRESHSKGVAWADYDNDGFLDLLIAGNKTRLYQNNGNGTFTDITSKAGIFLTTPTSSGIFGDYDNDGCKDLFLVGFGPRPDMLYHSNCDHTFTDITDAAGIKKESYHGFGAAWGDFDNDGYLDIYIANYGFIGEDGEHVEETNFLYHNNRDGTFSNVTDRAGVSGNTNCGFFARKRLSANAPKGWPFKEYYQPIWFDYNNDGMLDIFVANDGGISPLYRNKGNGTFIEVTQEAGLCRAGGAMGVTVGDYDNDGDLDFYVTNTGANFLWRNNGDGTFQDVAAETGVADPLGLGWGTGFFDYDNDGDLDIYVVNGTVPRIVGFDPEIGKVMKDKLYKNQGDGTFDEVSTNEGINGDYSKEAAAFGDYDNDGFTDIFVATSYFTRDDRSHLYKNQGNGNHWITVQLIGTKSNRDAIGVRIILKAGEKKQIREVVSGSSFISQNSLWQTFGLGRERSVDEIEVRWPSSKTQFLRGVKVNQKIVVLEEK